MSYCRLNGFGECSIIPRLHKEVHNIRRTFHNLYILSHASLCTRTQQSISHPPYIALSETTYPFTPNLCVGQGIYRNAGACETLDEINEKQRRLQPYLICKF